LTSENQENLEKELDAFRQQYKSFQEQIDRSTSEPGWYSENKIVFEQDAIRLRKFAGSDENSTPVLIVYSHVNRPVVIDLTKESSLIQQLIQCGHQVYLLDWNKVDRTDSNTELSEYFHGYIDTAVHFILKQTARTKINLIGICQGGTFSLCYACLKPEKINRLVTLVTPVDFHSGDSVLTSWTRYLDLTLLESHPVNIPGAVITALFQTLRPFDDLVRQVELIKKSDSGNNIELIARMDNWIYDCPDQPGKAFAQFVRMFYQENSLVKGSLQCDGRVLNLDNIRLPVFNVYARYDHLVPPTSSHALAHYIDKQFYRELQFPGGHIGLLISEKAHRTITPEITRWLIEED
jgi:polyhydroxyalkanoate synthase